MNVFVLGGFLGSGKTTILLQLAAYLNNISRGGQSGSSLPRLVILENEIGDEGIDGIIKQDVLGLDKIYIQAKRWAENVSRPEVQKFVGAVHGQNANRGVFITTSSFTNEAREYANNINSNIILVDGKQLAKLMIEYNIGVQVKDTIQIKKIDEDFFIDEG